jgi:hypothetical protein
MTPQSPAKQRAFRIDLDHHKRPDPFSQAKWLLSIAAASLSVLYAGYLFMPGSGGQAQLSPGDVAQVHAAWNHQCSECHRDFHAVRGDAWAAVGGGLAAAETKCQHCHAAPDHHNASLVSEAAHRVASCSDCHQEHRGLSASLVRIDDHHCTRCHARPAEIVGKSDFDPKVHPVTAFYSRKSQDNNPAEWPHPEFRSLDHDPGQIAFNHALHMTPGMPTSEGGRALSRYEQIADREYLRRAIPGWSEELQGNVQLACSSCHEPQASSDRLAFAPDRPANPTASRATPHLAPIQFERHCQACHALNIGAESDQVVPHGLKSQELELAVLGLVAQPPRSEEGTSALQRAQSRLIGKPAEDFLAEKSPDDDSNRLHAIREHLATATCRKCHTFPAGSDPFSADVLPSTIPQFWFRHARFDHSAHRAVDCLKCHEQALTSRTASDVMIDGYQRCIECHRPADGTAGSFTGVRHDCATCHTYHGGERAAANDHPRLRAYLTGGKP